LTLGAAAQTQSELTLYCMSTNIPGMLFTAYPDSMVRDGSPFSPYDPDQIHLGSAGVTIVNGQGAGVAVNLTFRTAYVYTYDANNNLLWAVFEW
jgi:hypothetical protein